MDTDFFADKKILLTQYSLRFFAGSEIVVLELAAQLQKFGADVTVFAWCVDNPLLAEFEKRDIYITSDEFDPRIIDTDFDYVWVNHQVLPMGLLNKMQAIMQGEPPRRPLYRGPRGVTYDSTGRLPYFIFYHMSALNDNSLEHPYACHLEKYFAGVNLCVSEEAYRYETTVFEGELLHPMIFPNQFPSQFLRTTLPAEKPSPERILMVSNHQPEELAAVAQILTAQGIEVTTMGQYSDHYELVTPELLRGYDAVITIGKTVQYCFASGIPVYIYDKFGGCGYLTEENFHQAYHANFSGRGFTCKAPEQIAHELVADFATAQGFIADHHSELINDFSLEQNLPGLFASLPDYTAPQGLTTADFNLIVLAEAIARKKIFAENLATPNSAQYDA